MYIRRFAPADADAVVRVSALATRVTSGAVYDAAFVEEMVAKQDRAYFLTRGEQMHFYVACEDDGTVIGCAAFGPYHKNPAEGCFYSVFVLPEKQRRGVGRALIETIEHDPMFFSAPRVVIPASINALHFYWLYIRGSTMQLIQQKIRLSHFVFKVLICRFIVSFVIRSYEKSVIYWK